MNELFPVAYIIEIRRQWVAIELYEHVKQTELLTNHLASVSEFLAWKAEHPRDGTMTRLYKWAPVMMVAASVLTMNPTAVVFAMVYAYQQARRK